MITISLWQPWATLWLQSSPDEKVFETRSWYTSHRGPLQVHAAKKRDGDVALALRHPFLLERLAAHGVTPETLPYGALIGRVNLIRCCRAQEVSCPGETEQMFGDWSPGRFVWQRAAGPVIYPAPLLFRGSQGFFDARVPGLSDSLVCEHEIPQGRLF